VIIDKGRELLLRSEALDDVYKQIIKYAGVNRDARMRLLGEEGVFGVNGCMFLRGVGKHPMRLGDWEFKLMPQGDRYLGVKPFKGRWVDEWPITRKHRDGKIGEFVRLGWWAAYAYDGSLCKTQRDLVFERANNYETKLVVSHRCGHSTCVRPVHLCLQTRYQDCQDRKFHSTNSGSFRPSEHL